MSECVVGACQGVAAKVFIMGLSVATLLVDA